MPFTVHPTPVLVVPVMSTWKLTVVPAMTFNGLAGDVIEMTTPDEAGAMVTLTDADKLEFAWLVAVTLKVAGVGTAEGAS